MKFRSYVAVACFVALLAGVSNAYSGDQVNKKDLIGLPVPYKGQLLGGWKGDGQRVQKNRSVNVAASFDSQPPTNGSSSTTLTPPPGGSTTTSLVATCPVAADSGDPTNLLFPLDGSYALVNFFGDGPGVGDGFAHGTDQHNDDDSARVSLPFSFPFYYKLFSTVWINNNGNLTFDEAFTPGTPTGFPIPDLAGIVRGKVTMVAPWWADVDTGDETCSVGNVWYRQLGTNTLVVTWDNVGYFEEHGDKLNTFQVAISDGTNPVMGLGNTICFSYNNMDWTGGDASGGLNGFGGAPANVGGNRGDTRYSFQIGEFDHDGNGYDGPFTTTDGVDFLDGFWTCFSSKTGRNTNIPPIPLFSPDPRAGNTCSVTVDTSFGQSFDLSLDFISPEAVQITTPTLVSDGGTRARGLSDVHTAGNPSRSDIDWTPTIADAGIYHLTLRGVDNFSPPASANVTCTLTVLSSCGNGIVEGIEDCDDGNTANGDCCDSSCHFDSAETACGSSSDTACTNPDTCDGAGTCLANDEPVTANCGDTGTECVNQDKCNGSGSCTDNGFVAAATACGSSSDTECTNPDTCDGAGTCQANDEAATVNCGDTGTECVNQDKCNGSGSCTDNGFKPATTACGSSSDTECTNPDTCDGQGTCRANDEAATVNCGDTGTECVNQDKCNGSGSCTDNGFVAAATACGSSSDTECTNPDTCDGAGTCQANDEAATVNCGDTGTECVNQDKCDGSGSCTDNGFVAAATACGSSSDTECTNPDTCDGLGTCQANDEAATVNCGDTGTECVNQDKCDGSGSCTDNGFVAAATACGSDTDTECTNPDTCDGAGTCQANDEAATVNCGDTGTECVNQDKCDGSG